MRLDHTRGFINLREDQQESYSSLIRQAQTSNSEAFEKLYRRYWPLIRRLWQRYPIANLEMADWEQEAQLVILEALRLYQGENPRQFSAFLKECLTHRICDLYRKSKANKRIPADQLLPLMDTFANNLVDRLHSSPDEIVYCHDIIGRFMEDCSKFECQVLAYLHCGYSVEEAAQHFDCTKRSIQGALSRCHSKLNKRLNGSKR